MTLCRLHPCPRVCEFPTMAFSRGSCRDTGPWAPGSQWQAGLRVPRSGRVHSMAVELGIQAAEENAKGVCRTVTSQDDPCTSSFFLTVDNKDELERSSGLRILQAGVGSVSSRGATSETRRCAGSLLSTARWDSQCVGSHDATGPRGGQWAGAS